MSETDNKEIYINMTAEDERKYKWQKKDFVLLGVPEGSFNHLMEKLELNTPEFMAYKKLKNNIRAKFYTDEAMKTVTKHLKNKEESNNRVELDLINKNSELADQVKILAIEIATRDKTIAEQGEELAKKDTEIVNLQFSHSEEMREKENEIANLKINHAEEIRIKDQELTEKDKKISEYENASFFGIIKAWRRNRKTLKLNQGQGKVEVEPKIREKTIAEKVEELRRQQQEQENSKNY